MLTRRRVTGTFSTRIAPDHPTSASGPSCKSFPRAAPVKRLDRQLGAPRSLREFIGDGKGTAALAQALAAAERQAVALRDEIRALETTTSTIFEPPPLEWVTERLAKLQPLLDRETSQSAILLRRVLGPVVLRPTQPEVGRPYYEAETALQVVDLLDDPEDGSSWLRKWRRGELNPRPKVIRRKPLHA